MERAAATGACGHRTGQQSGGTRGSRSGRSGHAAGFEARGGRAGQGGPPAGGAGGVPGEPLVQALPAEHVAAGDAGVRGHDQLLAAAALYLALQLLLERGAGRACPALCCCRCRCFRQRQVHDRAFCFRRGSAVRSHAGPVCTFALAGALHPSQEASSARGAPVLHQSLADGWTVQEGSAAALLLTSPDVVGAPPLPLSALTCSGRVPSSSSSWQRNTWSARLSTQTMSDCAETSPLVMCATSPQ